MRSPAMTVLQEGGDDQTSPFRFAVAAFSPPSSSAAWAEQARTLEGHGFSTLVVSDQITSVVVAPVAGLMAAAAATSTLRVGYLAALALRCGLGALVPALTIALDESLQRVAEQITGRPYDVFTAYFRATMAFLLQRIADAQRLLTAHYAHAGRTDGT